MPTEETKEQTWPGAGFVRFVASATGASWPRHQGAGLYFGCFPCGVFWMQLGRLMKAGDVMGLRASAAQSVFLESVLVSVLGYSDE